MPETSAARIARELKLPAPTVENVQHLFTDGNTIPFIARYRKEQTGGLDEVALSKIKERLDYFRELEARKKTVINTIEKQGGLTEELSRRIAACIDRYQLEDLYLPYKPKRRTRAQVARELGLEPLADRIFEQADEDGLPIRIAEVFGRSVSIDNSEEAMKGALDIVAERICENPDIRQSIRDLTWREGMIESRLLVGKGESSGKYDLYHKQRESVRDIPSHRMLAILRGSREKELAFRITVDPQEVYSILDNEVITNPKSIWRRQIMDTIRDAYERLLAPQIETEIRNELKRRADRVAIEVFAENLRELMLAAPLVGRTVLGLDPGFRTGVKAAVIDRTGRFLASETVYPIEPKNDVEGCFAVMDRLREQYKIDAVGVGNGTGGKETLRVVRRYIRERGLTAIPVVMVNEAGASIYSVSDVAREEFPELDATVRGAISIGRRLQDPLAELVKIDSKSIGVGQYQHDVDQKPLGWKLVEVVERCVNMVGVDLNTASAPLLARVAGMNARVARNVVAHRNENGAFGSRASLVAVLQFGEKTFEQSAGFLRVVGDEPLDNSAVHPERYELVRRIARDMNVSVKDLIGNQTLLDKVDKSRYLGDEVGEFTLTDILKELARPNRDPREDFSIPAFTEEVDDIGDLEEGMILEGVVTNVTNFGVFVDVGVHHDGMVHISELAHQFVTDTASVVKVGDRITVKVIEVDIDRKRIGLSRKQTMEAPRTPPGAERERSARDDRAGPRDRRGKERPGPKAERGRKGGKRERGERKPRDVIASGRMAEALMAALNKDKEKK